MHKKSTQAVEESLIPIRSPNINQPLQVLGENAERPRRLQKLLRVAYSCITVSIVDKLEDDYQMHSIRVITVYILVLQRCFISGKNKTETSSLHDYFVTDLDRSFKEKLNGRENLSCSVPSLLLLLLLLINQDYLILVCLKYEGVLLSLLKIYFSFQWVLIEYILCICYINEYIFV